jgi:hypothetical protein
MLSQKRYGMEVKIIIKLVIFETINKYYYFYNECYFFLTNLNW